MVVNGTLIRPAALEGAATNDEKKIHETAVEKFQKGNAAAMMVLTNTMTDEAIQRIMHFTNAREAWLELHKLYEASIENQLYQVCLNFFQFGWQGEGMDLHLSRLKNLWNELNSGLEKAQKGRLPDMLLTCKILDTLPSQYTAFKSSWLMLRDDQRTVDDLTTQLRSQEREFVKNNTKGEEEQEALVVKTGKRKQNHKKVGKCNYCGQKGHLVKRYPKWLADGKPPKSDSSKPTGGAGANATCATSSLSMVCLDEEVFLLNDDSGNWYIDNGASKHITKDNKHFIDFKQFDTPHGVTIGNGKILPVVGQGTLKIVARVNNQNQVKRLYAVWYVPEISRNLFSVLVAQDRLPESCFESTSTECWL